MGCDATDVRYACHDKVVGKGSVRAKSAVQKHNFKGQLE